MHEDHGAKVPRKCASRVCSDTIGGTCYAMMRGFSVVVPQDQEAS